VAAILRDAGHDVHTPTLTGLGERAHLLGPGIDLDTATRPAWPRPATPAASGTSTPATTS